MCSAVLRHLRLEDCGLRGPLPELKLPALQVFYTGDGKPSDGNQPTGNLLTGSLEPLRGCTALRCLSLHNNKLTGGFEPLRGCKALSGLTLFKQQADR